MCNNINITIIIAKIYYISDFVFHVWFYNFIAISWFVWDKQI